jgi:hypothetical protein
MADKVFMYTIYADLVNNFTEEDCKQSLEKQRPRDAILRKMMLREGIPDFPLPSNEIKTLVPFFQQKTRDIPQLNIILIYKIEQKEIKYNVIRSGTLYSYLTKQEAFDSITKTPDVSYKYYSYKVDA